MRELQSIGLDIHALRSGADADDNKQLDEVDLNTEAFDPLKSRNARSKNLEETIKELTGAAEEEKAPAAAPTPVAGGMQTASGFSINS